MTDYRSMYDRDYIGAWDLSKDRDSVVTISHVKAGELVAGGGRKSKKPVIYFENREKGFALNKTNGKTIAAMYGNDTSKWKGKRIALYPTTTHFGSETVDCIRVRPQIPQGGARQQQREPGDDGDGAQGSLPNDGAAS